MTANHVVTLAHADPFGFKRWPIRCLRGHHEPEGLASEPLTDRD